MNESLIGSVSKEEIMNSIFSIKPTKAPGPDGMTCFFSRILGHHRRSSDEGDTRFL